MDILDALDASGAKPGGVQTPCGESGWNLPPALDGLIAAPQPRRGDRAPWLLAGALVVSTVAAGTLWVANADTAGEEVVALRMDLQESFAERPVLPAWWMPWRSSASVEPSQAVAFAESPMKRKSWRAPSAPPMHVWRATMQAIISKECAHLVVAPQTFAVLHHIEGGMVTRFKFMESDASASRTCAESLLKGRLHNGWRTSTEVTPGEEWREYKYTIYPAGKAGSDAR